MMINCYAVNILVCNVLHPRDQLSVRRLKIVPVTDFSEWRWKRTAQNLILLVYKLVISLLVRWKRYIVQLNSCSIQKEFLYIRQVCSVSRRYLKYSGQVVYQKCEFTIPHNRCCKFEHCSFDSRNSTKLFPSCILIINTTNKIIVNRMN